MEKFYITTAIAYASQKPHFGNTFEVIMTDAIARYKRQRGFDVYFLTGTDEHGQKIENKALEAGVSPKEYVDGVASQIRSLWDLMGASYSHFIRTTDESHERAFSTSSRSSTIRGTSTRITTKAGTVPHANPFSRKRSLLTESVPTADARSPRPAKRRISSE